MPQDIKPFNDIARDFDPMMPADQYDQLRNHYFNNFVAPRVGPHADVEATRKEFFKQTERAPILTPGARALLPVVTTVAETIASASKPLRALGGESVAKPIQDVADTLAQAGKRDGVVGSSVGYGAGNLVGQGVDIAAAYAAAGPLAATIARGARGAELMQTITKGGLAFGSYEASVAEKGKRFNAFLQGAAIGAGGDAAFHLGGKLLAKGAKQAADDVLKEALNIDHPKPVNPIADQTVATQIGKAQEVARKGGMPEIVKTDQKVKGIQVMMRDAKGRPVTFQPKKEAEILTLDQIHEVIQNGGSLDGIIAHPDDVGWLNRFLSMSNKYNEAKARRVVTAEGEAPKVATKMQDEGINAQAVSPSSVVVQEPKWQPPKPNEVQQTLESFTRPDGSKLSKGEVLDATRRVNAILQEKGGERGIKMNLAKLAGLPVEKFIPEEWHAYKGEFEQRAAEALVTQGTKVTSEETQDAAISAWLKEKGLKPEDVDMSLIKQVGLAEVQRAEQVVEASKGIQHPGLFEGAAGVGEGQEGKVASRGISIVSESDLQHPEREMYTGPRGAKMLAQPKTLEEIEAAVKEQQKKLHEAPNFHQMTLEMLNEQRAVRARAWIYQLAREGEPSAIEWLKKAKQLPELMDRIPATETEPMIQKITEMAGRAQVKVNKEMMQHILPGAGAFYYPGDYRNVLAENGIKVESTGLMKEGAPSIFYQGRGGEGFAAQLPSRNHAYHENLHLHVDTVDPKYFKEYANLEELTKGWEEGMSKQYTTLQGIANGLKNWAYPDFSRATQMEEAFVHAATAIRNNDAEWIAQLAHWDTSVEDVYKMVHDTADDLKRNSFFQADDMGVRVARRRFEDLTRRTSTNVNYELQNEARELHTQVFADFNASDEAVWKIMQEDGTTQVAHDLNEVHDWLAHNAAGTDYIPSESLDMELRGVRGNFLADGLKASKEPPMPNIAPSEDMKFVGWNTLSSFWRPMTEWIATVDRKFNDAYKGKYKIPLYDAYKNVDNAFRDGQDWLKQRHDQAAEFLRGVDSKKLHDYFEMMTVDPKFWESYGKKLQMSSKDMENVRKADQWFRDLQTDTNIGIFNYLRNDLGRLRNFNYDTKFVWRHLDSSEHASFFHRGILDGGFDPKDNHLGRFADYVMRGAFNSKYMDEPIREFEKLKDLRSEDGRYVLGTLRKPIENYINYMRGIPDVTGLAMRKTVGDFQKLLAERFKTLNKYLPKQFQLPEEFNYPGQVINTLMGLSYAAGIGLRASIPIRDSLQVLTTALPILGPKKMIQGLQKAITSEGWKFAEQNGALLSKTNPGELYGDIFGEIPSGSMEKVNNFVQKLLAPSRWGHNVARCSAFLGEYDSAMTTAKAFREGKVSSAEFLENTSLWYLDKPIQARYMRMTLDKSLDLHQVAKEIALDTVDHALWPYRRGTQPLALRTGVGRIFGQYGVWPLNYLDFLKRMAANYKNHPTKAMQATALWAASNYAATRALEGLGADVGKWFWLSPAGYGGGPQFELAQALMIAPEETEEGRKARKTILEYPLNFIPSSVQIKQMLKIEEQGEPLLKSDGTPGPGLLRALGFKPLQDTTGSDTTLEQDIQFELGLRGQRGGTSY